MRHSRLVWIGFGFCLAVVLAAMGWVSLQAVRLDRARAEARRQEADARREEATTRRRAAWEENIRLALWRMDTVLGSLLAQEGARPYFVYSPFLPIDQTYARMFNRRDGELLIPSPLLAEPAPGVLVHFQFEPDGTLTSPQVPLRGNFDLAVPEHVSRQALSRAESSLAQVRSLVDRDKLLAMLPTSAPAPVEMVVNPFAQTPEQRIAQQEQRQFSLEQFGRGAVEFQQRNQAVMNNANTMFGQNESFNAVNGLVFPSTDVGGVPMTPLWIDGRLVLARRVTAAGREYVQGCLLDWPAIRQSLLDSIADLLPTAELQPAEVVPGRDEARMLAALPVRLAPGDPPDGFLPGLAAASLASAAPTEGVSPILLSLGVAWACVLLAAVAVAGLLAGVMRLSERRAAFVTAVTHELRTPLTTFQMYAEMLAEGMVPDGPQRRHYLSTLRAEAVRLTHLVENVLCYARLERGRGKGRLETVSVGRLLDAMTERLAGRAEQADMELVVEPCDGAADTSVRANVSAVEQVLFNLVDNACKYAAAAEDRRLHLAVEPNGQAVELALRDHGPGVPPDVRRRLFEPFSKSAQEAARSAPGVGLGLALSRRLARDMGGDLRLDDRTADGARFVLSLPIER